LTGKATKLITVALLAVVLVSLVGYSVLAPKMPTQVVTFTNSATQETSLLTSLVQTSTIPTSSASATSTTLSSSTILWINITGNRPVNYYLGLLESNRTEPYVSLARELRKLPDLTNATAVAKITYLALNSTNPEVKEAFELMMKGGTPDPKDFTYTVPNYNTELEVLYWLACQNEFKKDDTLALAIAMVNGLWVTMGDEQVRGAVKRDAMDLLTFFRETNELQKQRGYYQLEDYPLETKLCLAWTGGISPALGEYGLSNFRYSRDCTTKRLDHKAYTWDAVNVTTLERMHKIIEQNMWLSKDMNQVFAKLEDYFYFEGRRQYENTWRSDHWIYSRPGMYDVDIDIAGEKHKSWYLVTPNYQFDFFLRNGYVTGNCADETVFVEAWDKSWGIATTAVGSQCPQPSTAGHTYSAYYDPSTNKWSAYPEQLAWYVSEPGAVNLLFLQVFKPPVQQRGYLNLYSIPPEFFGGGMYVTFKGVYTLDSVRDMFSKGVPTSQMKQWLLYS
jgi:hypothetical protein